jgi:hypothetical protein
MFLFHVIQSGCSLRAALSKSDPSLAFVYVKFRKGISCSCDGSIPSYSTKKARDKSRATIDNVSITIAG